MNTPLRPPGETNSSPTLLRGAYRRALAVVDPTAGRGRGLQAARELVEGLRRREVPADLFAIETPGQAFTHLRSLTRPTDLVVAVGGDNTLREVFDGLVDPETHVGVLPFGASNVLATEFGYPRDVHHALEILARKKVTAIDVSHVNGHLSFLVTGVGFDAMAVREAERRRQGQITKLDYVDALARTLRRYHPPHLRVELDGRSLPGEYGFVLVSNSIGYAGLIHLAEDARIDDGLFEVFLFPTGRLGELMKFFVRRVFHRPPGRAVAMHRARHVLVTSEAEVPYQVDGALGGTTPVEIEIAPNQYRLVIP